LHPFRASFPGKTPDAILRSIQDQLRGRKLGDLSTLTLRNNQLTVTISKLGTSTLTFLVQPRGADTDISLTQEKLALTHKPFRAEVETKVLRLVERAGGIIAS
jgi:hypothetical protein